MGLPLVESLSGLQESVFSLFRGLQLNSRKKTKTNVSNSIKSPTLPLLAHVGPMAVWGLVLGSLSIPAEIASHFYRLTP